jgi:hypothetical protein
LVETFSKIGSKHEGMPIFIMNMDNILEFKEVNLLV